MDNIYPDQSNDKFDIQYARLLGLSSDIRASFGSGEDGSDPVIKTPDDGSSGFMRFGVAAEDYRAGENRSFDLNGAHSFALTQAGNNQFLVDPTNGLYQLGAIPVPGSDSGLSYTYLQVNDSDGQILLQAPEGIVLPGYGYGNHSGTETFFLAIDAGGNLIEVTGGSGSGTVNTGIAPRAAYYPVTGAAVDDWIGVEFGNTNLNTRIISQNLADVALEIKAIASQSANLLNISSSAGTGDLITVDGSGNSTFKQRARFQGALVETAVGVDRVDIGVAAGTPRIVFEDAGGTIWEVDNLNGIFRWFTPGVVQMDLSTSAASFANGLSVGTILGGSAPARQLHVVDNNATNSAVTQVFRMTHTTTGTPSVGIGTGMEFEAETGVLVNKVGAIIQAVTTNVGSGTEAFDLSFKTMTGGAAATESLRIISDGQLKITTITQDDTEDKIVVWNSTDKILEWRDAATLTGGGGGLTTADNGLTANTSTNVQLFGPSGTPATLLDNRYLATSSFTLNITTSTLGATPLIITSLNGGSGMFATAIGSAGSVGVGGNTDIGYGVQGYASGAGYSLSGYADNGGGIPLDLTKLSATTNTVLQMAYIHRETTGTAADGIGASLDFYLETNNTAITLSNQIISKLTTADNATRTSQLDITGVNSAVTATIFSLLGSGQLQLPKYGAGFFTGTDAYWLAVDSSGNIIEMTAPAGGSTNTIYNANDVLAGNRVVGFNSKTLDFFQTGSLTVKMDAPNKLFKVIAGPENYSNAEAEMTISASAGFYRYIQNSSGTDWLQENFNTINWMVNGASGLRVFLDDANEIFDVYKGGTYFIKIDVPNQDYAFGNISGAHIRMLDSASSISLSGNVVQLKPIAAATASAITPAEGMTVFVADTDGTFTSVGPWCYYNGAWNAL